MHFVTLASCPEKSSHAVKNFTYSLSCPGDLGV